MAHASIIHLAALHPRSASLRRRRDRRLRPIRPSRAVELWYRAQLGALVDQLRDAGNHIAAALRSSWPHSHDLLTDRAVRDHDRVFGGDATAPRLPALIDEAARKFGGIDRLAERLAAVAALRSRVEVDSRLAAAIRGSVGVDIKPVLADNGPIAAEMARAAQANVDLIVSIPTEYLALVRDAVTKGFEEGLRWESIAERIKEIGDITDRRARVIARDQVAKMNSAFNRVRQTGLGIKKYAWSGALDQRERKSHRDLEGQVFAWNNPPIVDGQAAHPGEPVMCFPGDSKIQFAHAVEKAYRRRYSGELAEIVTDSGKTLRATPNHPVLTPGGWLAIGSLDQGDYVIEVADEVLKTSERYNDDRVPEISEVFEATSSTGQRPPRRASTKVDFHGDGSEGDVDIVFAARPLFFDVISERSAGPTQGRGEFGLSAAPNPRLGASLLLLPLGRMLLSARRVVRRAGEILSLAWAQAAHSQIVGVGSIATWHAVLGQSPLYRDPSHSDGVRDRQLAFAGHVPGGYVGDIEGEPVGWGSAKATAAGADASRAKKPGDVVGVEADDLGDLHHRLPFRQKASRVVKAARINGWSGHVFNLQTASGWYVTNGIVTHNCRCLASPVFDLDEASFDDGAQAEAA